MGSGTMTGGFDGFFGPSRVGAQGGGAQGPQGQQGAQGSAGAQGSQGTAGAQGSQGASGAQGTAGAQGPTGTQGNQGFQGSTGVQGSPGSQGAAGAQGSTGSQGAAGAQGSTGAQGATGAQGSAGSQGNQGFQGITGAQGTTGVQGAQGAAGSQGSQGAQGNGTPAAPGFEIAGTPGAGNIFDDFGFLAWHSDNGGSGPAGNTASAGLNGVVICDTGTTAFGSAYMTSDASFFLGNGTFTIEAKIAVDTVPTATLNVVMGFVDSGVPNNGIYFFGGANANLQCICMSGGVATTTTTATPWAASNKTNNFYLLKIVCSPANSVTFYIDGVLVATISTNVPTSALRARPITIVTQAGLGAKAEEYCAYLRVRWDP